MTRGLGFVRRKKSLPSKVSCYTRWEQHASAARQEGGSHVVIRKQISQSTGYLKLGLGFVCHCKLVCETEESNRFPVQEPKSVLTQEVVATG